MKKIIEIEVEIPEFLDEGFVKLLSLLDKNELMLIKGCVSGMLIGNGKCTVEDLKPIAASIGKDIKDLSE